MAHPTIRSARLSNKLITRLILGFVALVMTACSVGFRGPPSDSASFLYEVSKVIPTSDIRFIRYAKWLPNQYGYSNVSGYAKQAGIINLGVFVLTKKEIIFLVSPDDTFRQFMKAQRVPLSGVSEVIVADGFITALGVAQRLVIVSEDGINSYEILRDSGVLDKEATRNVAEILRKDL